MPTQNQGWMRYALTILASVVVTMGIAMATIVAGKAEMEDVDKLSTSRSR